MIEITYSLHGCPLSQQKHISDLLSRDKLSDDTTSDTLIQLHHKLTPNMGESLANPTHCKELVGTIVYLIITRSDITYDVHIISQFVQAPTTVDYAALLRIFRYLRGTST